MAVGLGMLRCAREHVASILGFRRWNHIAAMPPPLFGAIEHKIASPQFVLPEFDREADKDNHVGFSFGGSVELMAVPKRKTSPHKRGIRNGPKALKSVPVIIRCKEGNVVNYFLNLARRKKIVSCGRVKLPHYYCCSGHRGDDGNSSMS